MPDNDPNAQPATDGTANNGNTGNNGQTDYQAAYNNLLAQLKDPNGPYVERKVYTGLQAKYQTEFDTHKRTGDALQEATNNLANLQAQVQTTSTTVQSLQGEKTKFETELNNAKTRIARFEIIGKEFPDLISWEAQGLLPQGDLSTLPQTLKLIHDQLEAKGTLVKNQTLEGTNLLNNSSDVTTATAASAAALFQEYSQFILAHPDKTKESQELWKKYQEAKAKEHRG